MNKLKIGLQWIASGQIQKNGHKRRELKSRNFLCPSNFHWSGRLNLNQGSLSSQEFCGVFVYFGFLRKSLFNNKLWRNTLLSLQGTFDLVLCSPLDDH